MSIREVAQLLFVVLLIVSLIGGLIALWDNDVTWYIGFSIGFFIGFMGIDFTSANAGLSQ